MITASDANKKTFKTKEAQELLKEKRYLEILKYIEDKVIKATEVGLFDIALDTDLLYPHRDKVIEELTNNGYGVKLRFATDITHPEEIVLSWK